MLRAKAPARPHPNPGNPEFRRLFDWDGLAAVRNGSEADLDFLPADVGSTPDIETITCDCSDDVPVLSQPQRAWSLKRCCLEARSLLNRELDLVTGSHLRLRRRHVNRGTCNQGPGAERGGGGNRGGAT